MSVIALALLHLSRCICSALFPAWSRYSYLCWAGGQAMAQSQIPEEQGPVGTEEISDEVRLPDLYHISHFC